MSTARNLLVAFAAGLAIGTVAGLAIEAARERDRAAREAAELASVMPFEIEPAAEVHRERWTPFRSLSFEWSEIPRRVVRPVSALMAALIQITLSALVATMKVRRVAVVPVVLHVVEIPRSARTVRVDLWRVFLRRTRRVRGPDRSAFSWSFPGVAALM